MQQDNDIVGVVISWQVSQEASTMDSFEGTGNEPVFFWSVHMMWKCCLVADVRTVISSTSGSDFYFIKHSQNVLQSVSRLPV